MQHQSRHTAFLSVNVNAQPQEKYQKWIKLIGKNPRYQYLVGVFITIVYILLLFNTMVGPYVFMNPIFQCNGQPEAEVDACKHLHQCRITNDFTAVYKNGLYCDKQPIRTTIQSIFGFGYVIGKIAFPLLCDVIGRRATLLMSLFSGILSTSTLLLSIEYNVEVMMMIGHLIAGIYGSGIIVLSVIYVCDICPPKIREVCLTTCWFVWGIAQMLFYILFNYIPHWRFYLTATLLVPTALVFILLLYFQVESPVFAIFIKKDFGRLKQIIKQISIFNRFSENQMKQIKQQGQQLIELLHKQSDTQIQLKKSLNKMFCDWKNLKTILLLILINLAFIFYYYGLQGSMQSAGLDFGLNMLFVGLTQGISYVVAGYVTIRVKRRIGLVVTILISSVVGLLFLFQFVKQSQILQTILVIIARLSSGYVFCFFLLLESQQLDVEIRSMSIGFIEGVSEFGRVAGPYVIAFMYSIKAHPIIVFSIAFFVLGAIPSLLLKQSFKARVKTTYYQVTSQYSAVDKSGILSAKTQQK